eukprot:GCRY01005888.1.p1 GENE.GCRY01005888.1~~GCRY01005888.1.p1  ORF type:complete len:391 (-),score=109.71 GCRY01005888.1:169-1341(-)
MENKEKIEEANKLYLEARRAFAMNQFDEAADKFSDALNLRVESYGEDSVEVAETYFQYGQTLYMKVRADMNQSDFLDSTENKEENETTLSGFTKEEIENDPILREDDCEEEDEKDLMNEDLEIAWEVLELARVIYSRETGEQYKLPLALVLRRLGDLAFETGNNDGALNDYLSCLEIREKFCAPTDLSIAETHQVAGYVLMDQKKLDDAESHVRAALEVVFAHIREAKDQLAQYPSSPAATDDSPASSGKQKASKPLSTELALPSLPTIDHSALNPEQKKEVHAIAQRVKMATTLFYELQKDLRVIEDSHSEETETKPLPRRPAPLGITTVGFDSNPFATSSSSSSASSASAPVNILTPTTNVLPVRKTGEKRKATLIPVQPAEKKAKET